jgi:anti-anti-sigma regulatory factor
LHDKPNMRIIELKGEATIHVARPFLESCRRTLRETQEPVRVEWSQTTAIDTSILQILIALTKSRQTEFSPPSPAVKETLELAGLSSIFAITSNRE